MQRLEHLWIHTILECEINSKLTTTVIYSSRQTYGFDTYTAEISKLKSKTVGTRWVKSAAEQDF